MRTGLITGLVVISLWSCQSKGEAAIKKVSDNNQYTAAARPGLDSLEIRKYHDAIESYLNSGLLRWGRFNGSILIAKKGTVVYEKYVGYKDLKTKEPITSTTPLQIASTSKPFTGMAILKLVQEGKLTLDTKMEELFPGFPYPGITVKLLLNHRSGLPNYIYYLDKGGWDKKVFLTNADVLQSLMTLKPARAANPDRKFTYCNTNYVLLALIIEKVTGQRFPDYLREHIFRPLQMNNTFVYSLRDTSNVAMSYKANGGFWQMDHTDGPYGDKNVYSTPQDLLKWDQAMYTNMVVNEALKDSAYTPYSNERPSMHNYGLGWRLLFLKNGKKIVYHNGHWHGFNSAFARLVDDDATIIILGSKYNSSVYTTARKLYNIFGDYDDKGGQSLE